MGFNKRYVNKKTIETYINENKSLDSLFKADAFIFMDSVSSEIYKLYAKNESIEVIKSKLNEYNNRETV